MPAIYLAGVVLGRNATGGISIENGRFHGKQIIAALAGKQMRFAQRHPAC